MLGTRLRQLSRARFAGRGFSLVEVITVLVIVSIMSIIAISVSGSTYQSRQRSAALQLAADLQYVREVAQTTGWATFAKVTPASSLVQYYQTPVGGGAMVSLINPAKGGQMVTQLGSSSDSAIYSGVAIGTFNGSTSAQYVGFDYQGRATDGTGTLLTSSVTITVTASGYANASVVVQPETGLITATLP